MKYLRIPPLPPARVLVTVAVMLVGIVTNEWRKNVASGLATSIAAIALSFWLAMWLSKPPKETPKDNQ